MVALWNSPISSPLPTMPLPLPFNPDEDLPSLRQRLDWADAGLLEGVALLEKPPMYEYEYEIWPLYKEPTEEEVEHSRRQLQDGVRLVAASCRCGGGCSVAVC